MKTKIVTSRQWNNPNINTFVSEDEVGASMDLTDFITALLHELGDPQKIKEQDLRSKVEIAAQAIIHEMKSKVVNVL